MDRQPQPGEKMTKKIREDVVCDWCSSHYNALKHDQCPVCDGNRIVDEFVRQSQCSTPTGRHDLDLEKLQADGILECLECGQEFYVLSKDVIQRIQSDLPYTSEFVESFPQSKN